MSLEAIRTIRLGDSSDMDFKRGWTHLVGFWLRELLGWALVGVGMYGYWIMLAFLASQPPQIIQGGLVLGASTALFRGGLSLIRLSSAARVVARRDDRVAPSRTTIG